MLIIVATIALLSLRPRAVVAPRAPEATLETRVAIAPPTFTDAFPAANHGHMDRALDHVNHEIYLRQLARDSADADARVYRALADLCGDSANHRVRRDMATYAARR